MTIRTSRIRRLKSLILALPLLALPIIAAAQDDSSAKPIITFAVMGDTGTGDEAQLAVARQMVRQRAKTPFEFVLRLGDNIYEKGEEKDIKPRVEEPYKALLEAGVKFYVHEGAFLNLGYRYEFFFNRIETIDDNSTKGNHVFTVGIGFNWGGTK